MPGVATRRGLDVRALVMRLPLRFRRRCLALLLLALVFGYVGVATARPFEVATFPVDPGVEVTSLRVAMGTDGTMVFAWQAGGAIWSQLYAQAGAPLAAPVAIATGAQPRFAADTRGGYVVGYTRAAAGHRHFFGRRLDAAGQTVGAEIAVDQSADEDVLLPAALGIPAGSAFVWQQGDNCWLRRYDADGNALGDAFPVGDNQGGLPMTATALDDGGITVVWHDGSVHTFLARSFNGDGSLRYGPTFLPTASLDIQAVAATPSGGLMAVGVYLSSTLRLLEVDASFAFVRQRDVAVLPTGDTPFSALDRDAVGRWLVTFATARYGVSHTLIGYLAPRALPLASDLTPLEPSFELASTAVPRVGTARLPSGSFLNVWYTAGAPGAARGYANVVSLCTPDVHTCGDGVLDARCEECDAGAGNDDDLPNTCRTSCVLPSCGDGTQDAGEGCDDGTTSPCNGCDGTCQLVAGLGCGDGILVAGCGVQCDDGNGVAGDGCASGCSYERIPGGGSRTSDCLSEWIVANPSNVPLVDGQGHFRRTQRCVDGDPTCDFDGGVAGSCTFHVSVCAGNTDVAGCVPAALATWELTKPSSKQAARRPELAAVRAAFAAVPASLTGLSAPDACSAVVDVVVPRRGTGKGAVALAASALTAAGSRDQDSLKLLCLP